MADNNNGVDPKIKEEVIVQEEKIIERNKKEIFFQGKKTVKLSPYNSIIFLLQMEDQIKEIYQSFQKIYSEKLFFKEASSHELLVSSSLEDIVSSDFDILTKLLLTAKSAHPYIINNINFDQWKIVTRNGSPVRVRDASEFNLGKSKHEAFTQLINLEEFTEGIEA